MATILNNPKMYDILYGDIKGDIDFYAKMVQPFEEVVEYGAGTGRITIPLAELGHKVIAVDNELKMLNRLSDKLLNYPFEVVNRIKTVHSDMVDVNFSNLKKCFIIPFTTFNYLLNYDTQLRCLNNIFDMLAINGIVVLELITLNTYPELGNVNLVDVDTFNIDSRIIKYSRKTLYNEDTSIISQVRVFNEYSINGDFLSSNVYSWNNCYIPFEKFKNMVELCGMKVISAYGDTNFSDYCKSSNDLFVVLKR